MNPIWDLIVVGGGPAGCSAATLCARAGMSVLLLEKGDIGRHKPCGGILPEITEELVEEIFDSTIPTQVFSEPSELHLRYTPPSGEKNGGCVNGSRLFNVDRDHFDQWLREMATSLGVTVKHRARVSDVSNSDEFSVTFFQDGGEQIEKARRLVAADGVHSLVRKKLSPDSKPKKLLVGQRLVRIEGDMNADFHCLFDGEFSPFYCYTVPKRDWLKIGTGKTLESGADLMPTLDRFTQWLMENDVVQITESGPEEGWAIPFGNQLLDSEGALFVGDAAGICNPLSGEGIRLALESGQLAAEAIIESGIESPVHLYRKSAHSLVRMVESLREIVLATNDEGREDFVMRELAR